MANRILKPDSSNNLILQDGDSVARVTLIPGGQSILSDEGGTSSIAIGTSGDVSIAENIYLASGKGIYFDGGTTSANYLGGSDAYEEGVWTPTHGTFTFSSATGHYTKIGNLVTFSGAITISNATTSNGTFGGLPFAEGKGGFECGGSVTWDGLNISGTTLYVRINNSAQTWTFYGSVDDGGANNTLTSAGGDAIAFCGHYYT
tara:strand:+ start:346 stop:954 length:609 start_codon:yes stop_codon:yes gene_type:complete